MLYATRCAVEGDHNALHAMNFGPREVDALTDVALGGIQRMASLRAHCLRIELNRGLFWPMIEHLRRQRTGDTLLNDLIDADASLDMMRTFYGVGGQFRGNVYALHDEPLPLADTVALNPHYMVFLTETKAHRHARVRAVAAGVLDSVDQDVEAGVDLTTAPENPVARRLEAIDTLDDRGGRRYFSFSAKMVAQLRNGQSGEDHLQKAKTAHDRLRNSKTVPKPSGLRYPSRLSENERVPADRYLERLLADRRQQVLDELEGRIRAEKKGAAPVISEVQFLIHLCRCVEKGTFLKAFSVERGRPLMRS